MSRIARKIVVLALALLVLAPGAALARHEQEIGLGGYLPYTNWQRPTLKLPPAPAVNFVGEAESAIGQLWHWSDGHGWYCGYLRCAHGPYPKATVWSEAPMFWAVDAQQLAAPSRAHLALVRYFGRQSERYWDRRLGGFAPYQGDRGAHVQSFFDDDGWLGLGFYEAYLATGEHRWLRDAQRDFRFDASKGWDRRAGGMWWTTYHPFHSGVAISVNALLATLLYVADGQRWQARAAEKYLHWIYTNPRPYWRQGFLAAPVIYAEQLLCEHGLGHDYCVRAGRMAATLAEEDERGLGGVREYAYNFGPQYDSIFMQWMMAYGHATGEHFWLQLAEVNAGAAAENARTPTGLYLSSWWGGPFGSFEILPNELQTQGATASLFAWTALYKSLG